MKVKEHYHAFTLSLPPVKQSATFHLGCLCCWFFLRSDSSLYPYLGHFPLRAVESLICNTSTASATVTDSLVGGLVANHTLDCRQISLTITVITINGIIISTIIIYYHNNNNNNRNTRWDAPIPTTPPPRPPRLILCSSFVLSSISALSPDSCTSFLSFPLSATMICSSQPIWTPSHLGSV